MTWNKFVLSDGTIIPGVAFGSSGAPSSDTMLNAIEVGFDHLDTAQSYGNEADVGKAIKESALSRDQLYITTKWSTSKTTAIEAITASLEKLNVGYVNLLLIHHPFVCDGDFVGAWRQMESIKRKGLTKSIGVSNFTIDQLRTILNTCDIRPVVNQIQLHPLVLKETQDLLDYMQSEGIACEGYSPNRPLRMEPGKVSKLAMKIAEEKKCTPDQVLMAWARQKGAIVICASSQKTRMEGYIAAGDVHLSTKEMEEIDEVGYKEAARDELRRKVKFVGKTVILAGAVAYTLSRLFG